MVTPVDALLVLNYFTGTLGETEFDESVCDVNGDTYITSVDFLLILHKFTGEISQFPVER